MTPGEIEMIPIPFQVAMSEMEERIMSDLIGRLKANREITSTADWQINRLYELGLSSKEIESAIQHALDLTDIEMKKLYADALSEIYTRNKALYLKAGAEWIPYKDNIDLQNLINAVLGQTKGNIQNITQSLGFAIRGADGKLINTPLQDFYQQTLDSAAYDIVTGNFDYNTVLKRTIQNMTNSGLRTIDYDSGYSSRVDVAVRRAVVTGVNQIQGKMNEQVARDLDTDDYEVTWHMGARPSHQEWQGKVYSYRELESVCGLHTAGGLCGANCYHGYNPFIKGVSVRTYSDKWLDASNQAENTPVEYAGKEYTVYEALQKQRKMETLMRKQRSDLDLLKKGDADEMDILTANVRYRSTMAQYVDFSDKIGLPQQKERVYQDGLMNVATKRMKVVVNPAGDAIIIAKDTLKQWIPNSITQVTAKKGGITRNYYGPDGLLKRQISNNNHGNSKEHPFGKNGEHVHDVIWKDGKSERPVRELTHKERKENADIWQD